MGSTQKIVSGVFWSSITSVINIIYGFISVPILLNYFGKGQYGLIGLACSINAYMQLMDMGLNSTNVRFFSSWLATNNHDKIQRGFRTSLSFYMVVGLINSLILLIVSFFSSSIFNVTLEQDIVLKKLIYVLVITAFIGWISSCFDQMVRATENVAWTQKRALIPKSIQVLTLLITIVFKLDILTYFILSSMSFIIVFPITIRKIKKEVPFVTFFPQFDKVIFREILPYSLNIFSFSIFQFSFYNLRPVFLGIQGTVESIVDYNVLMGLFTAVTVIPNTFISSLLPSVAKVVARHDKESFYKVAYDGTKYISIILCACCFGMMALGYDLISVYVGDKYLFLLPWLYLLLIITMFVHNQAISSLILAGDNLRPITYSSIIASIVGLISVWFLIPKYQAGGVIIGTGIYQMIQISFYYFYYWPCKMNISPKRIFVRCFFPYVLISVVVLLICQIIPSTTHYLNVIIIGLTFAILYSAIVYFTLNKTDKQFLSSILPSINIFSWMKK